MLGLGAAVYGRDDARDAHFGPGIPGSDDRSGTAGGDVAGDRHTGDRTSGVRMKAVVYGNGRVVQVGGDQVIYER
ncbi:hypothetical protein C1I98_32810 [Spongiactinospora gelatinilytica]|uniref:Uncharacterized protein n=1 Tax=Spongiactinospora gelatinilytica TaxID=2666298 RepID=A0A2W2FIM3_9ACTN|nr:hypothetical protein [Spongiactinospora gelatinilytica]PZG28425.1 hypothetical protein C1I98_32810 [Spongiactinospora gelatinilytica]